MLFAVLAVAALAVSVRSYEFIALDESTTQAVDNEWTVVLDSTRMAEVSALSEVAAQLKGKPVAIGSTFRAVFVNGVTKAALTAQLEPLSAAVKYVEQNGRVFASATGACEEQGGESDPVSWGQVRTSGGASPDDGNQMYNYESSYGEGTVSYIIDTGIFIEHKDFEGRAVWGTNTIDNSDSDGNGHGTHVASTVGGAVWGLAKQTKLVAVKVLSASGGGTFQSVIGGIEYAAKEGGSETATGNMSLGGGSSSALDNATDAAVDAGVVMVVAGGNSNADSCNFSPAGADKAITVGSTTLANSGGSQVDVRSSFSNYGSCTQLFAPGSDITAAWINGDESTRTISGTSMASPHVCGVANALLSQGVSKADILKTLTDSAHKDVITLNCSNSACNASPNLLLTLQCED